MGEAPQLFRALMGLFRFYLQRADYQTARELSEQSLTLAQHAHDPARLLGSHTALGMTVFYLGEFLTAQEHLEQGIALYAPLQHHPHASVQDPGVACMSYAAWVLWVLGYPDQARQRTHEMLTLTQELSHPYSLAFGLTFAAVLHSIRREERETQARAEAALQLATA